MKTSMRVLRPDDVEMSLTVTMRLRDWTALSEQLANEYPSWELSAQIGRAVEQVRQTFFPREEASDAV